jgi:hypothetical protein
MAIINKIEYQELLDNYEFKAIKKLLKISHPWIIDFIVNKDEINKYNIIFVGLVVNPKLLKEKFDWDYGWYIKSLANRGPQAIEDYLRGREFLSLSSFMEDDGYIDASDVKIELSKIFNSIKKNPAIPNNLKLVGRRSLDVDGFYIDPKFIEELKNDPKIVEED